jgi:membrane-associated protein
VGLVNFLIEVLLNLDKHLDVIIRSYGIWTYAIFFLIIFLETGLVITPFLPGDSLLFATGTFAALGSLDLKSLFVVLSLAAIGGDTANYWIGTIAGPKIFRFLNKEYLYRTQRFYEKYGGKTIVLARFIPIIRTFAPFVAGMGTMMYRRFILYNITGGIAWVVILVLGGYFFGNIPLIRQNFSLAIFAIIFISILPGIVEYLRHRHDSSSSAAD